MVQRLPYFTDFGHLAGVQDAAGAMCIEMLHEFSESLGLALDARDEQTHDHSRQVADISLILARELGLSDSRQQIIHIAGHLHDIGKIAIADSVLKKVGPLDDNEWQQMREHPVIGARIVAPIRLFNGQDGTREIILHHHERYDGGGYPNGLRDVQIPIGSRIIAVADSISAMMQNRYYRRGLTFECVEQEIVKHCEQQFCPKIVRAFLARKTAIRNHLNRNSCL